MFVYVETSADSWLSTQKGPNIICAGIQKHNIKLPEQNGLHTLITFLSPHTSLQET